MVGRAGARAGSATSSPAHRANVGPRENGAHCRKANHY